MTLSAQKMLLTAWLTAIVLEAIIGCGSIKVNDKEVCGDLGYAGAHCAHTLTDQTRDINRAQWDLERVGYLCMSSTSYNDTETTIDQFCATTKLCDYQTKQAIKASLRRVRGVAKKAQAARKKHRKTVMDQMGIDIDPDLPHDIQSE